MPPRRRRRGSLPSYAGLGPDQILDLYPEHYRRCRVRGHDPRSLWRVLIKAPDGTPALSERTEVCTCCGRTRRFTVTGDWRRTSPSDSTNYPQAYGTPKSGLRKSDFASREYEDDYHRALKEGRVIEDDTTDE